MKPKQKSIPIGPMKFDIELAERLKKAAIADQRSMANIIRMAVRKYLDSLEIKK